MTRIKLSGQSDDIINIKTVDEDTGAVEEDETGAYHPKWLLFSDGTVIKGEFDGKDGWRFTLDRTGSAIVVLDGATDDEKWGRTVELLLAGQPLEFVVADSATFPEAPAADLVRAARIVKALHDAGGLNESEEFSELIAVVLKPLRA